MTRLIFLLTDFGTADTYVGVVKAVILGIAPDAPLVDLTHDIPPQDVRAGAFALLTAAPYLPGRCGRAGRGRSRRRDSPPADRRPG